MNLGTDDTAIAVLVVFFVSSLVSSYVINKLAIIYRIRFLQPSFVISISLFVLLFVGILRRIGQSFSDSLAIIGLIITFLFGFGGSQFLDRRKEVLAVLVITSKAKFHRELRKGFHKTLAGFLIKVEDEYSDATYMYEDLSDFIPAVQRAEILKPDYLIVVPASKEQSNSEEIADVLSRITKRGGRIIFIENPPDNIDEYRGMVTCIYSDSLAGARILAGYAKTILSPGNTVLFLNGPDYSDNSDARKRIFVSEFEDIQNITIITQSMPGWSEEGTYTRVKFYLQSNNSIPDIIICGNDTMALGAVRAIKDCVVANSIYPKVFGYDGLFHALISIADHQNPFFATIRIPPSSYGNCAANIIMSEVQGRTKPGRYGSKRKLIIDGSSLVTKENGDRILEYV